MHPVHAHDGVLQWMLWGAIRAFCVSHAPAALIWVMAAVPKLAETCVPVPISPAGAATAGVVSDECIQCTPREGIPGRC